MPIFDTLIFYGYMVLGVLVLLCIGVAILFFLREKKRKTRKLNDDATDYNSFERKDACDYIKIDDIKDNMIQLEKGKRFVGIVSCQGYDLYSAEEEEQASTARNFVSFVNTIKKPITYRQYCKNIDLEHTTNMYKEAYERVETRLYNVIEDIKDLESSISELALEDSRYSLYQTNIEHLKNDKRALENREYHLREEIQYCEAYSGGNVSPELKETWVFEWYYNAYDFPVELTNEEIYQRAQQELKALENTFRHALSSCRVKTRRCNTEELIEMCRRYSSPLSAERFRLRDVMNSTFFDDIVTTDNIDKMIEKARKKVEDEFAYEFEQEMKDSMQRISEEESAQGETSILLENDKVQGSGPVPANTRNRDNVKEGE